MKILYLGQLFRGSTALHRALALERLGHELDMANSTPSRHIFVRAFNKFQSILKMQKLSDIVFNYKIRVKYKKNKYDIVWVDKGIRIAPNTLAFFRKQNPNAKFIHYSPDDMLNPSNQSKYYLNALPIYDLHVTTKSYNVSELKALGAKDIIFVDNAYEPSVHKKIDLTEADIKEYSSGVGFIGAYEKERAESIKFLCENNIKVTVWGKSWSNFEYQSDNLFIRPKDMLEDDYTKVLNATKINLCFLRKVNRDLQTTRSIEIPACGALLLAERTVEHQKLYKEGYEAAFFSSNEELLTLIQYFQKNPDQINEMAERGYNKTISAGYSNDSRLAQVLQYAFNSK